MYQYYFCPFDGCHSHQKRSDYLRTHIKSHGNPIFKAETTHHVMDQCRRTILPIHETHQVEVRPADPSLGTSFYSVVHALEWMDSHIERTPFSEILQWEGVQSFLSREAGKFTLDISEALARPPSGSAQSATASASGSGSIKPEPGAGVEPVEALENEEMQISPSSSNETGEIVPPPSKRPCPNTLPGISEEMMERARQATTTLHQGGKLLPIYSEALEHVRAAEGGETWIDRRRQYHRAMESMGVVAPLADLSAMAPPPFIKLEDRAKQAPNPHRSKSKQLKNWQIEPKFDPIGEGQESFKFVYHMEVAE